MAWNRVQHSSQYPYAAFSVTIGANDLVVLFMSSGSNVTPTITDSNIGSSTWTLLTAQVASSTTWAQIAYCYNHPAGSATIAISNNSSYTDLGWSLHEYSGNLYTSTAYDGYSGATPSGANPSSGNISTTGNADLLVGFLANEQANVSPTAQSSPSGWAIVEALTTHYAWTMDNLTGEPAGSYACNPTASASADSCIMIAAFLAAPTGVAVAPQSSMGWNVGQSQPQIINRMIGY